MSFEQDRLLLEALEAHKKNEEIYSLLDECVQKGYNPTHDSYSLFNMAIELQEAPEYIAEFMMTIMQHPSFICKKEEMPEWLVSHYAASSYWLDVSLYNDKAYKYASNSRHLNSADARLVKMLDVGVMMMEKGFDLRSGQSDFGKGFGCGCAVFFLRQCVKRYDYKHQHKKQQKARMPNQSKQRE